MTNLSILEKLQHTNSNAEIWWDSSPLIFPAWQETQLYRAPDSETRRRWSEQLERFMVLDDPNRSLVRGVTTNPSLIAKSILGAPDIWGHRVRQLTRFQSDPDVEGLTWLIYLEAVRQAAKMMMPMWRLTEGRYGWVSGQLDPRDMFDIDRMMEQAMQIARLSPNLMVKVPGTRQGYEVIRRLTARGISTNNTLSYSVPQFVAGICAVKAGLAEAHRQGVDLSKWRCVVTYMIGRFGSQGDLLDEAEARGIALTHTELRWAEVAILKQIQKIISQQNAPIKMLLSSLEVDDPAAGATTLSMHLQETAGADIAYTCKPDFITHLMSRDGEIEHFDPHGIHHGVPDCVMRKLERLPYFCRALESDGMTPDDFSRYGPFVSTHAELNGWTRRLVDFTARHLQPVVEQAEASIPDVRTDYRVVGQLMANVAQRRVDAFRGQFP